MPKYVGGDYMQKKKIKPTKKDVRIMHYMSKIGGVSYEALIDRFGYSKDTISKRFSKLSCIHRNEEKVVINNKTTTRYVYSLNKEGKDLMLKMNLNHNCCAYNGYIHQLKAEQQLFKMVGRDDMFDKGKNMDEAPPGIVALEDVLGEAEQKFMHEANIKILRDEGMDVSVVDFMYKNSEGEIIAVEVETENYRKERREAHYNYVNQVLQVKNDNYIVVK